MALDGQMHVRISEKPETQIFATALALESRERETVLDQAIMGKKYQSQNAAPKPFSRKKSPGL